MNSRLKTVLSVTRWEFGRFFKWKDLLKGFFYMVLFGVIGGSVGVWLASDSLSIPDVAVIDYSIYGESDFESDEIRFLNYNGSTEDELLPKLESGELDAVLQIVSADSATIRMQNERGWLPILRQYLKEKRTIYKLSEHNIDAETYAAIEEGMTVHTRYDHAGESSRADKIVAGISIFLVLMAVFMGFAYQFTAITAEKQQRITEQVISAIHPQTWIDGKILGITGIGLVYVMFYGAMGIVGALALVQFAGAPFGAGLALLNPLLVILFLLLALLGILMWNSFLAGVAATIDDPNSSERAAMMFLPMLPVFFAFFTLANPDGIAIKTLGIFPLTSYAVLPARMVLTQVAWWEPVIALALLAATVWLFRSIAGKIFSAGMMMYGKEPSIKEMIYWFRRS